MSATTINEPASVIIETTGIMHGRNGRYEKHLGDMGGVYGDDDAYRAELAARGGDAVVYQVDECRVGEGDGALILGTSTVRPGMVGQEFALTRGHLHRRADRAETYHCVSGHGVMLLETLEGYSRAMEMTPGVAVHVPGHWIHRSVNVGDEPLVTIFVYNEDAGQDYDLIARAGGMSQLIVSDGAGGWHAVPNPRHTGYRASGG